MADKTSIQFVSKFIEFAIPTLLDYPIDFQLFLSRVCSLVAIEVTALCARPRERPVITLTSNGSGLVRSTSDRLSLRRFPSTSCAVDQQKTLTNALKACYPDQEITRKEIKLGVGRFRVKTDHGYRLYEQSTLTKDVQPEQVRLFLADGLIKSKSTSGVLISSTSITGAQRMDLFGVPVSEEELIPVVFIANIPKDEERMENLLLIADEVLRFLVKNDEQNTDRDCVANIFTVMPKVLHVISQLLNYMEIHGANLRSAATAQAPSIKVPEYRALSLSGGRTVVSTSTGDGSSLTRITTTPLPTKTIVTTKNGTTNGTVSSIGTVTSTSSRIPSISTVPGLTRKTITSIRGGSGTVTERTFLTTQMRSMSMPKRYGKNDREAIQREIERFNKDYQ